MYDYLRDNPGAVNQALQATGSSYQLPSYMTAGQVQQNMQGRRQAQSGGIDAGAVAGLAMDAFGGGDSGAQSGVQANPYDVETTGPSQAPEEEEGLLSSGILGSILGLLF